MFQLQGRPTCLSGWSMADERGAFLDLGDFSRESEENNARVKTDKSRILS